MIPKVGDRVLLADDHPWAGHTGTVTGWEILGLMGYKAPRIELDNGRSVFATDPRQVQVVKQSEGEND